MNGKREKRQTKGKLDLFWQTAAREVSKSHLLIKKRRIRNGGEIVFPLSLEVQRQWFDLEPKALSKVLD